MSTETNYDHLQKHKTQTPLKSLDEHSVKMMGECTTVSAVFFFRQDGGDVVNFLFENFANFLGLNEISTIDATARQ